MAYNNMFPMGYQQVYTPPVPQAQPQGNPIIWVSGEAGAKAYLVAPNSTAQLWDSEAQTIYLKSADASGMPSIKVLDYVIREQNSQSAPAIIQEPRDYITREEFSALSERVDKLRESIKTKEGRSDE